MLRVLVSRGGCSGFQYGFSFDDTVNADDRTFVRDGVTAVANETSLELLNGAEVDFVEDLGGSAFQIRYPNATPHCGRSEEHTSELQSLMRHSYAGLCFKKKTNTQRHILPP